MSNQTSQSFAAAQDSRTEPRLRLWPGVAIVALMWLARFVAGIGEATPSKFFVGLLIVPAIATIAINLWWLLGSRLNWSDRGLVCGLFLAAGAMAAWVCGQNFPAMGLIIHVLPVVTTIWVGWLLATFRLRWPVRRAGLIALLVLTWGFVTLVRIDGMDGSFATTFSWRWSPTAEEKLLAELAKSPRGPADQPAAPANEKIELKPGDWPGFRGAARDGRLRGVRIATDWSQAAPREVWRHRIGPGWSSFAVVGKRLFTQEQRGDNELVVCYDAETGDELWAHHDATRFTEVVAGPGPRGTPTFDEGWIYALGANGRLNCLDAATGELKWSRDIVADSGAKVPQWGFASSPLLAHGIVTVFAGGPEGKSVLGYRAASGELAWAAGDGELSYCSTQLVSLDGVEQLLITTDVGLSAFHPETGNVLWQHRWPVDGMARIVQPALVSDTDVLIGTGMGVGTRRVNLSRESDKWLVKELWTSRALKPYYNDFVVYQNSLYGFDGNIFMCVDLDDGRAHWRTRGYGNGQVLLLVDQALLVVLTEQGEVVLVEAQPGNHKEIGRFQAIDGKTWNHPVIAHGKLFVRNGEEVACFALKMDSSAEAQTSQASLVH